MSRTKRKFDEIENLLIKILGEKIVSTEEYGNKYLNIKGSHFWMSNDFDELIIGFGLNHTHFSEKFDNLNDGIFQAFDLLTNRVKTTDYIKGNRIFKTTVEIEYPNAKPLNIGTSTILIYPFWKKTKIEVNFSEKLLEKKEIENEVNLILNSE